MKSLSKVIAKAVELDQTKLTGKAPYVDGKKLARNGRKTATYSAASFLSHYRRDLFSHLLVFNLWTHVSKSN